MTEIKADNLAHERWEEMVFQNRNQDYGAFIIRQLYTKHIFRGLVVTMVVAALFILIPFIVSLFTSDLPDLMDVKMVVQVEMTSPPPIEIKAPKLAKAPEVKSVDKNLPPEVVKKEVEIPEDPPPVQETKKETPDEEPAIEDGSPTGVENGEGQDNVIYEVVEKLARFPGGEKMMFEFISNNTRYPMNAVRSRLNGTVFVTFVVNVDGSLDEVKATTGFFKDCDREAERLVRSMPNWEPAIQGGKPVRTRRIVRVIFQISKQPQQN